MLASCAQTVSIDIELRPGVRAVRALSRDGVIAAQSARFRLNQVYQSTEHYVLLEVEIDKQQIAGEQDMGRVRVAYTSPGDGSHRTVEAGIAARFGSSQVEADASRDHVVLAAVVEQATRERAATAIRLRDEGRIEEASCAISAE